MPTLKSVVKEIGASSAAIMVPNVVERYLYCYDSYNMPPEWVAIKNYFNEKILSGNIGVYKVGKPVISNHLGKLLKGHHIESVMIVPIMRGNTVIATLELIHSDDNKVFSDNDLQKATDFANVIGTRLPA